MNIAVAPHMPIIANGDNGNIEFDNLSLLDLPTGVTLYVPEQWLEFLTECPSIVQNYELFSQLLELPVQEVISVKKANYIKLTPDVLANSNPVDRDIAKQQLYAIFLIRDAKRIYGGIPNSANEFTLLSDKGSARIINFDPTTELSLREKIDSYAPKLKQLKHYQERRTAGNKEVSPFSAYDKYNEDYACRLLRQAYEEHPGDINDETYLYTYDYKFKTFVEFRPDRNNEYHGMDISKEDARKKCPQIMELYHK